MASGANTEPTVSTLLAPSDDHAGSEMPYSRVENGVTKALGPENAPTKRAPTSPSKACQTDQKVDEKAKVDYKTVRQTVRQTDQKLPNLPAHPQKPYPQKPHSQNPSRAKRLDA
ncbi:hypothetical protein JCM33374_g2173 [Metschnikowia sp. JCM 33374]|nr:hypothetical protein JCM33374_g2173 [Metschnikowia sp. JCM 33374]